MDSLRRSLVLGLPVIATVGALQGCGGAESDQSSAATAQSSDRSTAQADTAASSNGNALSIRNRDKGNFPVIGGAGGTFDITPQLGRIQAVINAGLPGGTGPVLSVNLGTTRLTGADTKIGSMSLTIKLGSAVPTELAAYDLRSGGALASEGLLVCRQVTADGSVKSFAFRIVSGILTVYAINRANNSISIGLSDLVANAAIGFSNLATGSISVNKTSQIQLTAAFEDTGIQLT